ncbi:MAG TPA: serine/threonine-protein kinase [Polyangiaceae bacterium]|nr:serine/threonine-protein kinase [Polyangiaceae bacterium]
MVSYQTGALVAGRYQLGDKLGEGGFGVVFRALDTKLQREVALKLLHRQTEPLVMQRFRREIELARQLNHPNTVRLYEFGETETGVPYIAWELLRGRSLEQLLASEGGLHADRVRHIGAQVLKSLMEAHALGIVHRDIKPANLFLCDFAGEPDFVKVLDFGIATLVRAEARPLTSEGSTIGTPQYMAPEQVLAMRTDARTDLYALGLVLAEALSGRRVYDDTVSIRICMAQASPEPVPLPEIVLRSPLAHVIHRATQKNADARPRDAAEMLAQMDATPAAPAWSGPLYTTPIHPPLTSGSHVPPTLPGPVVAGPAAITPSRRGLLIAGIGVVVTAGALGLGLWFSRALLSKAASDDLPRSDAKSARSRHEVLAGFSIDGVSAQKVLNRLAADGWAVTHEYKAPGNAFVGVNYVVQNNTVGGAVMFHEWPSATEARIAEDSYRGQHMAVVRDDRRLLAIQLGDEKRSQQLLERLLR